MNTMAASASTRTDTLDFSQFTTNERIWKDKPRDVGFGRLYATNDVIEIRSAEIPPFISENYLFGEDNGYAVQGRCYLELHQAATSMRLGVGKFVSIRYVGESGKEYPKVAYGPNQWVTIQFAEPTKLVYFEAKSDQTGEMQIDNITFTY